MITLKTCPADAPGIGVVARVNDFHHQCPIVNETDRGTLTVWWITTDRTIELHSLHDYLDGWETVATTHEDLVTAIAAALTDAGIAGAGAQFTGRTAGLTVTVTRGDRDAVLRESLNPTRP